MSTPVLRMAACCPRHRPARPSRCQQPCENGCGAVGFVLNSQVRVTLLFLPGISDAGPFSLLLLRISCPPCPARPALRSAHSVFLPSQQHHDWPMLEPSAAHACARIGRRCHVSFAPVSTRLPERVSAQLISAGPHAFSAILTMHRPSECTRATPPMHTGVVTGPSHRTPNSYVAVRSITRAAPARHSVMPGPAAGRAWGGDRQGWTGEPEANDPGDAEPSWPDLRDRQQFVFGFIELRCRHGRGVSKSGRAGLRGRQDMGISRHAHAIRRMARLRRRRPRMPGRRADFHRASYHGAERPADDGQGCRAGRDNRPLACHGVGRRRRSTSREKFGGEAS